MSSQGSDLERLKTYSDLSLSLAIPFVLVAMILCMLLAPVAKEMNWVVDRPAEDLQQIKHGLTQARPFRRVSDWGRGS